MKYTRYDFKKKKDDKIVLFIMIVSMLLAAVLIATVLSSIFFKNGIGNIPKDKENSKSSGQAESFTFVVLQGGLFQVKENAEALKTKLSEEANPFVIEESGKYRVFAGIYEKDDGNKALENFKSKQIDTSKMTFDISVKDESSKMMEKILEAHVKIVNALKPKGENSYTTDALKDWSKKNLSLEDKKLKYYDLVQEEKKYIEAMPKEINKDNLEEYLKHIFTILNKIGEKA